MRFHQKKHETQLKCHRVRTEPPFAVRTIDWMHQTGPRKGAYSILLSVIHMLCINHVCHGVSRCVKNVSCSSSSLSMDSINGMILLSKQNVRRYQTHHRWQLFLSGRQRTRAVCVYHSPIEWKMWFSCFPVLPGSAEAQVIWGGIVKCLLIVYFISNISAKEYQNPFMCVKVISSQMWNAFWDTV